MTAANSTAGRVAICSSIRRSFVSSPTLNTVSETVTRVPAVDGWFTTDDEPHLIGARCPACATIVFPPREGGCPNPECDSDTLEPTELSRRGRVWSYTENHYAPPPPYVAAEPFEPYALAAVELDDERIVVLGQVATGVQRRRPAASAWRWSSWSTRSTTTTTTSTSCTCGHPPRRRTGGSGGDAVSADRDVAVLGVGMHPWGKWGRNFVEYGVVAARAALADAGLAWTRHPVRRRRRHHPQRLPGLRRRRHVRPGARLDRRARVVAATPRARRARRRSHQARAQILAGLLRRRARGRRRHHAEGLLRARRRRAQGRPRLAALPPARRHQPDVLRALRPPAHGALRRDRATTSPRSR